MRWYDWRRDLLYRLSPSRQVQRLVQPLRDIGRDFANGQSSLDAFVATTGDGLDAGDTLASAPAVSDLGYSAPQSLYELSAEPPEPFGPPMSSAGPWHGLSEVDAQPAIVREMTPVAEINAAIDIAKQVPDAFSFPGPPGLEPLLDDPFAGPFPSTPEPF